MRTVYATTLEVGSGSDVATALEAVGMWIEDWYRRRRFPVDVFESLNAGDSTISPADGHNISVRHYRNEEQPDTSLIDLCWSYPDQYDKSLGWVITLSLLRREKGLQLSIDVAVTGLKLVISPARFKLGSPRVIRDLSRLRSVQIGGYPYNLAAEIVGAEHVEVLVSELKDSSRPYPVVLVSKRLADEMPLIDLGFLADRLAGVAKIYELADKWAAFRLTEELGKVFSCFGGAVRLYWPGFTTEDKPTNHPLWMPWQFKDADATENALALLCNMIFEASAFRHVEPMSISEFRSASERQMRELARSSRTKTEDELLDDLVEMEQKLRAEEAKSAQLAQDNKTLRDNVAALMSYEAWGDAAPGAQSDAPSSVSEPAKADTVVQAVQIAAASSKFIRFLEAAYSSASDSPYKQPERVLEALQALEEVAALWAHSVDTGESTGSVRSLFKERGFEYADDISQTTKGKWGDQYTATYDGQELDIAPHITLGAKQPETCISIHWAWHKAEKVAIVAHVGRHKTNTKT